MAILVRQASRSETGREADSLAAKLLEAVYERKSEETGVRGRMEEQGRATGSCARAVAVGKGPLAAGECLPW